MGERAPVWMLGERPAKLGPRRCWHCGGAGFVRRPCPGCGRWKVAQGEAVNVSLELSAEGVHGGHGGSHK